MKKVLFILLGILCAVSAGAVSYASPYRGSGRGAIYTMSSSNYSAASAGLAPGPVATMGSVSSASTGNTMRGASAVRTMTTAMTVAAQSRGIYTAATAVSGGVTTYDNCGGRPHKGGIRKTGEQPGWSQEPEEEEDDICPYCIDVAPEDGICDRCGCYLGSKDGCTCASDPAGYCWCPLDMNWSAMLFMAVMAAAYAVWKRRTA